jgi:hypothetical protein
LTTIDPHKLEILTNPEVIAVDQDTTGLQGQLISDNGAGLQVWVKKLHGKQSKERAVVLLNGEATAATMSVKWKDLNLLSIVSVRDLWKHADLEKTDSIFTSLIPSHGVVMLKVVGNKTNLQEVFEAEYAWINNFNLTRNSTIVDGQGKVVRDSVCSGHAKVTSLGNNADNYIEFRDVYSNYPGRYRLTISYLCGDSRNAELDVNGVNTHLTNLISGDKSITDHVTCTVRLKKGYNTIRISNSISPLPDIDKIQLDLNRPRMFYNQNLLSNN